MRKNSCLILLVILLAPFAMARQRDQLMPVQKGTNPSSNVNTSRPLGDADTAVVPNKIDEAYQRTSEQAVMQNRNDLENPRVDRVIKREEIEEDHRKMLWQDKTVDKDGYLRVESSAEYLNLPGAFLKHPKFSKKTKSKSPDSTVDDIEAVGRLDEDQYRVSYAFRHANKNVVFTVWNYRDAGATYIISEEFLNQKVSDVPAVLSLSFAKNFKEALWKLTWWNKGFMFELYVSDVLDRQGTPQYKPHQIIHIADRVMKRIDK